jgi:hypothetical protein
MLRMQERTFPGFKFQMHGILATHAAFSHCYPPLIYYLTESPFSKNAPPPPTGKSLKKVLAGIQANSRIRYTKIMFSIHNIKQRLTAGKINVNNLIKGHIHEVFPKRTNLLANLNLLVKLRCINHRISLFQSNTD